MRKRVLSIFLVFCLVLPFVPKFTLPTKAAENRDAFGIKRDETIDEKKEKANNPYGTENWFNLFTVSELFVAQGNSDGRRWDTWNYNRDKSGSNNQTPGSISAINKGTNIGSKSEGNNKGFTLMDTAACDAKKEGQKRYVAVLGYWKEKHILQLFLSDQYGNRVSNVVTLGNKDTLDYLGDVDAYESTGFISVAAGDFDGDGKDSVVVYVPQMESKDEQPQLWTYSINNMQLSRTENVCNLFDVLETGNISTNNSNNSKVKNNTPAVQMTTEDTDNDNIDELIVTAGMNNCSADDVDNRQSRMFVYDYVNDGGWKWNQTFQKNTHGYAGGYNGAKRLRWAGSSVGNLVVSDDGPDCPEILTAGWIDKKGNDSTDLTSRIGGYITFCNSVSKVGVTSVGNYSSSEISYVSTSEFTSGGHYEGDDRQCIMPVCVFNADGVNNRASVLIADTVYQYEEGTGLVNGWHADYFNDDDDGIGDSIISNGLVQDAVAANFDGNEEGREQVVFTTCQKRKALNQYFYDTYTYQKKGNDWSKDETDYTMRKKGDAYMSLCAPDVDSDSTIARIKSVSLSYTEPEVLALLEATPYFSEIDGGDIGNSETAYGKTQGSGSSTAKAKGLTTNIVAGFEWSVDDLCAGFVCGAGFETSVEQGYTWETAQSTTEEYTLNYSNDTGENAVVVYRRPVKSYCYEIKNTGATMVLARQGTLLTSMVTLDEYNEVAESCHMEPISEETLAEPGNPFSYHHNTAGLENLKTSTTMTQYAKGGTVSQEFSDITETEKTFTYDLNASFTAYGMVFGVKAGGGAGTTYTESQSTIDTTSITKSGAVTGKQVDGYDFNWKFAHWTTKVNDTAVPVLGYILTDVVAPPSPPLNLDAKDITETEATLTWEAGQRSAEEYRIYQVYSDGSNIQIGTVDGTETEYHLTGLKPDTTYKYVITAYNAPGTAISGESVFSEEVIVTTLPEGMGTVSIISPENFSAKIGGTATFKADFSSTAADYKATNYKWQKRMRGGEWSYIDGATKSTLTLTDVQASDHNTEYRCVFRVSYTSASSLINYYSESAILTVGQTDVTPELTVNGYQKGEGSLETPYEGKSDYARKTGVNKEAVETTKNVIIEASGTIPQLTVYKDEASNYYGIGQKADQTACYYLVTKSGETYTAGKEIVRVVTRSYKDVNGGLVSEGVPAFHSEDMIVKKEGDSYYHLQAVVDGTPREGINTGESGPVSHDSRLGSVSEVTYYWKNGKSYYQYGENGSIGDKVELSEKIVSQLYDVYYNEAGKVVIGREETWTVETTENETTSYEDVSAYWFALISSETKTEGETTTTVQTVTPIQEETSESYKAGDQERPNFNPSVLERVTRKETEFVETPVYTTMKGTELTLTASVIETAEEKPAENAAVEFKIVNTETNAVETISKTVGADGKVTAIWSAPAKGLYSIQLNVLSRAGYGMKSSEIRYYHANETYEANTTEYRLQLMQGKEQLTGTMVYGGTVNLRLQERTVPITGNPSGWKECEDTIIYTVNTEVQNLSNPSYTPGSVGDYLFHAYKDSVKAQNEVASVALQVTKKAVTIQPVIKEGIENPTGAGQIEIQADPEISGVDLNEIFDINCGYFDNRNQSGKFDITLSFKTTEDGTLTQAAEKFRNNYAVTLKNESFTVKPDSAQVQFTCKENGAIVGRYGDNWYPMASGSSKIVGTRLRFIATPDSGYGIASWTINGKEYAKDATHLPDGMKLSDEGKILSVESFDPKNQVNADKILSVEVKFRSIAHEISYSVSDGEGTLRAQNGEGRTINSGTKVTEGSKVVLTAVATEGYVVSGWKVNDKTCKWDGTQEDYRGTTFTLPSVSEDKNITVSFKKTNASYRITTSVADEDEKTDQTLAKVTAEDGETGKEVDLTGVTEGTTVKFTATVADPGNQMVKLWQTSTDGVIWQTVKGSGGNKTIMLYNVDRNLYVRPVITTAQSFGLSFHVTMDGKPVTDEKIAFLTANSNGQTLTSGNKVSAYIPVDFSLTLNPDYYVTGWSSNVTVNEDENTKASLAFLEKDTTVEVVIKEKPVVSIDGVSNGTLCVSYMENGKEVIVKDKDHISVGTDLTALMTPDRGYVVSDPAEAVYVDGTGDTTDAKSWTISDVKEDIKIHGSFAPLNLYRVTFDTVIVEGDKANGTISASSGRRNISSYKETEYHSGNSVYEGGYVKFTAEPDEGYMVQEWRVDGEICRKDGIKVTENTLTLSDIADSHTVTVQFKKRGAETTIEAGEHGKILQAVAGGVDQIENISSGFILAPGAEVEITAQAEEGYKVDYWTVNNEKVQEGNEKFIYTADEKGTGVVIGVHFVSEYHTLTFTQPQNGTLTAVVNRVAVESGQDVKEGTKVTFTVKPNAGYIVSSWMVDGKEVSQKDTTYELTVEKAAEISVKLIPGTYEVTYKTEGDGKLFVAGAAESITEGAETVKYGESIVFQAVPQDYWHVSEWKVDKEKVTDGISEDGATFTLSDVKADHSVEVIFKKATLYEVSYQTEGKAQGSLKVTADGTALNLSEGQTTSVEGGSRLVFTAIPDYADDSMPAARAASMRTMVKEWKVNGETVEGNVSNQLVIDSLGKKIHVTVEFEQYEGYPIPESGDGYVISEVERTPDDTDPETEIRKNGDLQFKVSVDSENGYVRFDRLKINGYDCLKDTLEDNRETPDDCASIQTGKNEDGSYTVLMKNITGEIQTDIVAHKHSLKKVEEKKATCTQPGTKEHWICEDENCGELFFDEEGKKAAVPKDLVIPAIGHNYENGICKNCGQKDPTYLVLSAPVLKAAASGSTAIKLSWAPVKDASGYVVYRYNTGTKQYNVIARTAGTALNDTKRTPGTVYAYLVRAYGVRGGKTTYSPVSNGAKTITKPKTPKITSLKKTGAKSATIQLKTEKNVKGYYLYEYMWQTKKYELVGKIEGKKYYKYSKKKKKFVRDRKSKVKQSTKKKTISVQIKTHHVNFSKYRKYRFKVKAYVKFNGKDVCSGYSKKKIMKR
ncbi:MAG: fibronectin type III domain-containing protein [Anaerobutyricum sp.]|nr:fibronectin type III domain-containing protein [Anaerobutyricum sp.]